MMDGINIPFLIRPNGSQLVYTMLGTQSHDGIHIPFLHWSTLDQMGAKW